jgi:hypothetical protein
MTQDGPRKPRSGLGLSAAAIAILLALSQLSVGPVVWLMDRGMLPRDKAQVLERTLYAPLVLLCEHSSGAQRTVRWYISLWEKSLPAPPPAPPPPAPPPPAAPQGAGTGP